MIISIIFLILIFSQVKENANVTYWDLLQTEIYCFFNKTYIIFEIFLIKDGIPNITLYLNYNYMMETTIGFKQYHVYFVHNSEKVKPNKKLIFYVGSLEILTIPPDNCLFSQGYFSTGGYFLNISQTLIGMNLSYLGGYDSLKVDCCMIKNYFLTIFVPQIQNITHIAINLTIYDPIENKKIIKTNQLLFIDSLFLAKVDNTITKFIVLLGADEFDKTSLLAPMFFYGQTCKKCPLDIEHVTFYENPFLDEMVAPEHRHNIHNNKLDYFMKIELEKKERDKERLNEADYEMFTFKSIDIPQFKISLGTRIFHFFHLIYFFTIIKISLI